MYLILSHKLRDYSGGFRRVRAIVLHQQFNLLAIDTAGRVDLVSSQLDAVGR
jgi:hypothetical protein